MPRIPQNKKFLTTQETLQTHLLAVKLRMEQVKLRRLEWDLPTKVIPYFTPMAGDDGVTIRKRPVSSGAAEIAAPLATSSPAQTPPQNTGAQNDAPPQDVDALLSAPPDPDSSSYYDDFEIWSKAVSKQMQIEDGDAPIPKI